MDRNFDTLIIGHHPILYSILKQFKDMGRIVRVVDNIYQIDKDCAWKDIVILTSSNTTNSIENDNKAIESLRLLRNKTSLYCNKRPIVHLLLESHTSLFMLQTIDLPEDINDFYEVYPFTIDDIWAKNILVHIGENNITAEYPALDREPITINSKKTIHLVISGFDKQAESIALHTALIAHYPNYNAQDDKPLRSRITIIDNDIFDRRDSFISRYQYLFDNSYYRTINIKSHTIDFHYPIYYSKRNEFVDVEWEFVNASINSPEVIQHINQWIESSDQQLTFVISHGNDEYNMEQCMALPHKIFEKSITIFVQQGKAGITNNWRQSLYFKNIYSFGMYDSGYDVTLPLVKLAKLLKYFYDCSYDDRGVPTELPPAAVDEAWNAEKSYKMRFSNIYNVMTITSKMRSVGHGKKDANKFYALTHKEVEELSETEHNRWCVERLILGTRPCNDIELAEIRADITKKKVFKKKGIHFDLRAYNELENDETGKNARVYDYDLTACIPLIVKSFYDENQHG